MMMMFASIIGDALVTILFGFAVTAVMASCIPPVCYGVSTTGLAPGSFDPNNPAGANGYILVFDSEFNDFSDFDTSCTAPPANTGCTNPPGKNWYLDVWTMPTTTNTTNVNSELAITNGILSIHQIAPHNTGNWALASVGPHTGASQGAAAWQKNWNGHVFGGGWYVEGRIQGYFKSTQAPTTGQTVVAPGFAQGHHSIWAYNIEHFNTAATEFIEDDMMDGWQGTSFYETNLIDWYNNGGNAVDAVGTGMNSFDQVNTTAFGFPTDTFDINGTWHIFGQLWVPATATAQGYIQNYLDGVPTSKFMWNQYSASNPVPPTGANIGAIIDIDHMSVNLGADPPSGTDPQAWMFVDWVHVWQLPTAATASGNAAVTPQANFTGAGGSCPH